jgi:hypothetical protein
MSGTDANVKAMPLSSTEWMKPTIGSRGMRQKWVVECAYDDVTHLAGFLLSLRSSLRVGGSLGRALRVRLKNIYS